MGQQRSANPSLHQGWLINIVQESYLFFKEIWTKLIKNPTSPG